VAQNIQIHTFPNGLTLLGERMEHVRSAAVNFLVPSGYVYDPPKMLGMGSVLAELTMRGAGNRDSRELSLAMDNIGLDRSESVGPMHMRFWGATLARNIPTALELYADVLRQPHLPKEELEPAQALLLQDLQGLEDDPKGKVMVELRRRHWPDPLGRDRRGTPECIEAMTAKAVRAHYTSRFGPRDTILAVAGNIEWEPLRQQVQALFGDWKGGGHPKLEPGRAEGGRIHLDKDTTQTQIALAYPSVPFGHEDYYAAQGAVQVLSGGMGARLFTEVREKRGLCYAVYASYQTFKDRACILAYAGTTNERAQETLDVTVEELRRIAKGVTTEEIERVQAGLKSSVIMQEESTSARAGALASEWYYLARVRPLEEIQAAINSLTPERIVDYVRRWPARDMTVVTLGPAELKFPD
jgi:predicted Zn-dependent peptidase